MDFGGDPAKVRNIARKVVNSYTKIWEMLTKNSFYRFINRFIKLSLFICSAHQREAQ